MYACSHPLPDFALQHRNAPLTCKVCGMACPSRNQLFKHIQQTGYAAFK